MPDSIKEAAQAFLGDFTNAPLSDEARVAIERVYMCGAVTVATMVRDALTMPEREELLQSLFREFDEFKNKVVVIDEQEEG